MYTELKIQIHAEDIGVFYQLLADYHTDKTTFLQVVNKMKMGNDERQGKVYKIPNGPDTNPSITEPEKDSESFYSSLLQECTCGTCFNTFARPSRTPWKAIGNGVFCNSEHGRVTIKGCSFSKYSGKPGYVYKSYEQQILHNKVSKLKAELATTEINQHLQQVVTKQEIASKQQKGMKEQMKISKEVDKLKLKGMKEQQEMQKQITDKEEEIKKKDKQFKDAHYDKTFKIFRDFHNLNREEDSWHKTHNLKEYDESVLQAYSKISPQTLPAIRKHCTTVTYEYINKYQYADKTADLKTVKDLKQQLALLKGKDNTPSMSKPSITN